MRELISASWLYSRDRELSKEFNPITELERRFWHSIDIISHKKREDFVSYEYVDINICNNNQIWAEMTFSLKFFLKSHFKPFEAIWNLSFINLISKNKHFSVKKTWFHFWKKSIRLVFSHQAFGYLIFSQQNQFSSRFMPWISIELFTEKFPERQEKNDKQDI